MSDDDEHAAASRWFWPRWIPGCCPNGGAAIALIKRRSAGCSRRRIAATWLDLLPLSVRRGSPPNTIAVVVAVITDASRGLLGLLLLLGAWCKWLGLAMACARDGYSHINSWTRTTITMNSSSGTARKRALSDPEDSECDRKKTNYTGVDYGHPTLMAQPHWPIGLVYSLL